MKGKVFAAGLAVLLLIGGIIGGLYYMENYDKIYYTKVDNSQITELSGSSDMKYEYDLSSYDESGKKRNLKFKTSRELKENAYLLLEVRPRRVIFCSAKSSSVRVTGGQPSIAVSRISWILWMYFSWAAASGKCNSPFCRIAAPHCSADRCSSAQ